jgi:hypothetical protein
MALPLSNFVVAAAAATAVGWNTTMAHMNPLFHDKKQK